jgi:mycothiol synthase
LDWQSALNPAQQDQIGRLIDAATLVDGVAPVGEHVLRDIAKTSSDEQPTHLLATQSDTVIGYLNVARRPDADAMAELVVHPDNRRIGIGSRLIQTAQEQGPIRFWAHGTTSAASKTAEALGMTAVRSLMQMCRPLRDLPDVTISADIVIRAYEGPADDAELLRVNNAAFDWHPEQGGWTAADIAERRAADWFDPEGVFLAFDAETHRLLGFHWTKVHPAEPGLGEVYVVGVGPDAQGRGLGRVLTLVGLHHLAQRLAETDEPTVMLYVESDNSAAVRTYEKLGFGVVAVDTAYAPSAADAADAAVTA